MQYVIETKRLCKTYGGRTVVHNLDLHVPQGCVYGFIGPNGAGKSTSMKMLLGLVHPTAGSVALLGRTLTERTRLELLRQTGSLIESPSGYLHLTAQENLEIVADLKGVPYKDIDRVLEIVHLQADRKRKVGQYSLGMKQRLGLALALVGSPELLLLDEPFNGIDPQTTRDLRRTLVRLNQERAMTIVISSHVLDQLMRVCTRFGVIASGRMVREFTDEELHAACVSAVRVKTADPARTLAILEERMPGAGLRVDPDQAIVVGPPAGANGQPADSAAAAQEVSRILHDADQVVLELTVLERDIESYFVELMD